MDEVAGNTQADAYGKDDSMSSQLNIASQHKRFLNYLIDSSIISLVFLVLVIFQLLLQAPYGFSSGDIFTSLVFNILVIVAYYTFFEVRFGKTPAKFITKTKVLTETGDTLSLRSILIRSICRMIPFEQFSFLSWYPVGWHDRISCTRVIDENPRSQKERSVHAKIFLLIADYIIVTGIYVAVIVVVILVFAFVFRSYIKSLFPEVPRYERTATPSTYPSNTVDNSSVKIASVSAYPENSTDCPTNFSFVAEVTSAEPTVIAYQWERSDASIPPKKFARLNKGEKTQLITSWYLNKSSVGWQRLHILSPVDIQSPPVNFSLSCN